MPRVKRIVAVLAAALVAVAAASARADELPGTFSGHGISFTYPAGWEHKLGALQYQVGSPLWAEFFAPPTPLSSAPVDPANSGTPSVTPPPLSYDVVILAAYHVSVSITKKNLPRYRSSIRAAVTQLVGQAHEQILAGPTRVALSKLPGYRFDTSVQMSDGTMLASRLVFVFRQKTEYFLNCQHVQDGPLATEIDSGCAQVMQSFTYGH